MNQKLLAVVRREFVSRVRTKSFVITTLLLPVLMLVAMGAPILLMNVNQSDQATRVAIVDGTSIDLGAQVREALASKTMGEGDAAKPRYVLTLVPAVGEVEAVRQRLVAQTGYSKDSDKDKYDGVLVLPANALESGTLSYDGANASSLDAVRDLRSTLSKVFASVRLARDGLDVAKVTEAMRPVELETTKVSAGKATGQSGVTAFIVAYAMSFLLYIFIMMYGQTTLVSVIEEKTSRVVEVLVSSLTPFQMLLGKVLGVGGAGLLQMAIWGVSAWVLTAQAGSLGGTFGVDPATMAQLPIPHIGGALVTIALLYFILGFFVYGALYAAIGSMCNTIQDSQQYATVVTMLLMLGFFAAFAVIQNPDGVLAQVFSWIPFFAPFVMPVRWSLTDISIVDLVGSLALMVLGVVVCSWVAARIYHTGLLMFGKKPSWREIWRWIRTS